MKLLSICALFICISSSKSYAGDMLQGPLVLFSEAFSKIAPSFEQAEIKTTWGKYFHIRADTPSHFEDPTPSGSGIWIGVRVLPIEAFETASKNSENRTSIEEHATLRFPRKDSTYGILITFRRGKKCDPKVISIVQAVISRLAKEAEQGAAVTLKPITVDEWKAILSPIPETLAGDAQGLSDALYEIGSPLTKIQKPATPESNRAGISGMLLLWYSRSIRTQFNSEADKDNWQMERNALTAMIRAGQKYHPELINDGWANLMKASEAKGFPRCELPK